MKIIFVALLLAFPRTDQQDLVQPSMDRADPAESPMSQATTQGDQDWNQHTAISPDGETILLSYRGDIHAVSAKGGTARPLTVHNAWEGHPVWSHDGKQIAFASDRYGSLDVFVMSASGGKATRLTFHSAHDVPSDFTPDGNAILFSSPRTKSSGASIFPTSRMAELYEISAAGGTPSMVSAIAMSEARYSGDGAQVLYRDEKSYESNLRKHDTSAFARDVWRLDRKSGAHTQLTTFSGADHNPVGDGGQGIYYLSEQGGDNLNVWHMNADGESKTQVSRFAAHPVRSLSVSEGGVLAYTHHGQVFTQVRGEQPQLVKIDFATDTHANDYVTLQLDKDITEFAVSPNGKEVAFVNRGEVFVTSRDFETTKRITNTAEQERSVSFHKDGRTLLYAGERGGRWKLYEASLGDPAEKYFFTSTSIVEKQIYAASSESFQPAYSPDGKKIAFLAGRDEIQVLDRESGAVNVALGKEHNYSYTDGDIYYAWSADSAWLVSNYAARDRLFVPNIGVFPADGSAQPVDVSRSGYSDYAPFFGRSGDVVLWASSRFGQRDHGSWGREFDIMASFLSQDAFDKFRLSKEEYQLVKELRDEKAKAAKKDPTKSGADAAEAVEAIAIEWNGLNDRTIRLTKDSAALGHAELAKDWSKLYFVTHFDKGSKIWVQDFRESETKLLTTLDSKEVDFRLSEDDKTIFILAGGTMRYAKLGEKFAIKSIKTNALMELKPAEERAFMFEHAWRQVKDKFYQPDFHGVDWDAMKAAYQVKLPSISNNRDLARMLEEMTGELNASHIWASYRPKAMPGGDKTASLGVIFDLSDTSGALTIAAVLDKSPLKKAKSAIRGGMKLTAIDGVKLGRTTNLAKLLNNKAGSRTRLTIEGADGTSFEEVTTPISIDAEAQLMYERWVKSRRVMVEKLSNGRLGYVHVRGMDDDSFRVIYSEILGHNFDKEAIVVDTRWNGGGWLHNDLAKLLNGKEYFTMHVRGRKYRGDSLDQWNKPSVLVIGEGNYSDAYGFPFTYGALDIGEMVGMPVPGTMTAVWWETMISGDVRFGVPQVGVKNMAGEYLENKQIEPDHKVMNDPQSTARGEDKQLAKAVQVMLRSLDQKQSPEDDGK